ncbi:MAG: DNA primase, partial [Cyanobacteria bacterium J06641_5]
LWLDWQIEKMLASEDISQGDRFQVVAAQMVKLIGRLEDANQRAHYIRFCAERLAQGNSRLVALYSDNLLGEVKRRRSRVRSKHKPAPADRAVNANLQLKTENALLERAESLLLRVYLHYPRFRKEIDTLLEEKELIFSASSHRFLWQIIAEVNRDADFLARLQDRTSQEPDRATALAPLFVLDETRAREIDRPGLVVRAAIATMEQVACEKHKQYCLEQWQKLDPSTQGDRREYYYKEFYEAQRRALILRRQRQFSLHEILEIPAS